MRAELRRWSWQLAQRLGPEGLAATLTVIAVLLVAGLIVALVTVGS